MGIKPTEGEVREVDHTPSVIRYHAEMLAGYSKHANNAYGVQCRSIIEYLNEYANLLAEQANAVPVAIPYALVDLKNQQTFINLVNMTVDQIQKIGCDPLYLHPPKDTNPLNHPTQDLYEHFLAVHNLYHTDDLRKAFYHGAGEHTPEELAGFLAKGEDE